MKKFSIVSKILAVALMVASLLSLASCSDTTWAYKKGDKSITSGMYIGYLIDAYYEATEKAENQQLDVFDQKIEKMEADEYIKKAALNMVKQYFAVEELFNEYKLEFTTAEKDAVKASVDSMWGSIGSFYEENGCGKQSFAAIMENDKKKEKIFEYYYSDKGVSPLPEADRKDFFVKNFAKVKFVSLSYYSRYGFTTSADATDAQKNELKKAAEEYLERLNKGEDINKLIAEEKTKAKGYEQTEEAVKVEDVAPTFYTKDTAETPDAVNAAIFKASFNTPTLIENSTQGYYVLIRYDLDPASKDYTERATSVLSTMKKDEFDGILEKKVKDVKVDTNDASIKRYKPQNITFDIQ